MLVEYGVIENGGLCKSFIKFLSSLQNSEDEFTTRNLMKRDKQDIKHTSAKKYWAKKKKILEIPSPGKMPYDVTNHIKRFPY